MAEHLAQGVAGKLLDEEDPAGALEPGEPFGREADELVFRRRGRRRSGDDPGGDQLAPFGVGGPGDGHLGDAGVLEEDVLESMEAGSLYRLASIDAGRSDDEASPNPAQRLGEIDPELSAVDDRVAVSEMLAVLPEREQKIVYLRFFEGLTQSEIAEEIGISQMHVSRLLVRSLETLGQHASLVAEL